MVETVYRDESERKVSQDYPVCLDQRETSVLMDRLDLKARKVIKDNRV
jgi:hypothetical protein